MIVSVTLFYILFDLNFIILLIGSDYWNLKPDGIPDHPQN